MLGAVQVRIAAQHQQHILVVIRQHDGAGPRRHAADQTQPGAEFQSAGAALSPARVRREVRRQQLGGGPQDLTCRTRRSSMMWRGCASEEAGAWAGAGAWAMQACAYEEGSRC